MLIFLAVKIKPNNGEINFVLSHLPCSHSAHVHEGVNALDNVCVCYAAGGLSISMEL